MIFKSCKKLIENYEEWETFTNKYTENVGGKSEWISDGGFFFGEPQDPPAPEITAKCVVHFRPKATWQGEEFGFDWMRIEDTSLVSGGSAIFGDTKYETIVAKQYKRRDPTVLEDSPNEFSGEFRADATLFGDLKREYTRHTIPWKTTDNDYYCAWLSLFPSKNNDDTPTGYANTTAKLSLVIDIEEEPEILRFESNNYFTITPNEINVTGRGTGKFAMNDSVTIECLKEFSNNQTIVINAITRNNNGTEISKPAGKLNVWANNASKRKKAKILLVDVETPPLAAGLNSMAGSSAGQQALFEKYLRQALIETSVETKTLNLASDTNFVANYVRDRRIGAYYLQNPPAGFVILEDYLYNKLKEQIRATSPADEHKYDSYFKAFYLGERGGYIDGSGVINGLNGYSLGNNVVLFPSKNDQTAAHEFLHSFNLPHSFTNKEADANALFTFEYAKTENLMDYSHRLNPPQTRYSLWKWQWEKANASITNATP